MTESNISTLSKDDEVRSSHAFMIEGNTQDTYFCKCGNIIEKNKTGGEEVTIRMIEGEEFDISDISELHTNASNIVCDKCGADYSKKENYSSVVQIGTEFMESYAYVEDDERLTLYKFTYSSSIGRVGPERTVLIRNSKSYIAINKISKKMYFMDFGGNESDFTLDEVFPNVKRFYNHNGVETTSELFEVHKFLNRLANFVSDSKNINVIDELMSQMIGRAGIDIIIKVNSIFFGIICYPNLSTIALTKGTVFLYDMLNGCNLPNPSKLSDNGVTSPIKIFNFLVNLKNKELKSELDSYDHEKTGYVFKSKSGTEHTISYDASKFIGKSGKVEKNNEGVFVRDDVSQKSVSPYILNRIKKFSEYETLIRYTKFISYQDLVNLVIKHEPEFLIGLIDKIEFRDEMNMRRLEQFVKLATSFIRKYKNITRNPRADNENLTYLRERFREKTLNFEVRTEEEQKIIEDDAKLDFSLIKYFDLGQYDDCLRMISSLNWNPEKEFYKIKDITELHDYHDQLVEHYNMLSNKEKNGKFVEFVSKFKFLEKYDGDLRLRLIKTPDALLNEAKEMKNCAASYVNRISSEQYILFTVEDICSERSPEEPSKYMLGIFVNKHTLEFDQVKAACNRQGSDRFKKQVMKYLESKDISYKELADLRIRH